jgi:hypothetical protein
MNNNLVKINKQLDMIDEGVGSVIDKLLATIGSKNLGRITSVLGIIGIVKYAWSIINPFGAYESLSFFFKIAKDKGIAVAFDSLVRRSDYEVSKRSAQVANAILHTYEDRYLMLNKELSVKAAKWLLGCIFLFTLIYGYIRKQNNSKELVALKMMESMSKDEELKPMFDNMTVEERAELLSKIKSNL